MNVDGNQKITQALKCVTSSNHERKLEHLLLIELFSGESDFGRNFRYIVCFSLFNKIYVFSYFTTNYKF